MHFTQENVPNIEMDKITGLSGHNTQTQKFVDSEAERREVTAFSSFKYGSLWKEKTQACTTTKSITEAQCF